MNVVVSSYKAPAHKASCLSYSFLSYSFLLCGFGCPVEFLCGFARKTAAFGGHAQYAGRRIAQTRRMLHVKPVVCCTLNCVEPPITLHMQQYWLIKRIGPALSEVFRCHIYALQLLVTFCPVLDFNGNKSRFFLRRSRQTVDLSWSRCHKAVGGVEHTEKRVENTLFNSIRSVCAQSSQNQLSEQILCVFAVAYRY